VFRQLILLSSSGKNVIKRAVLLIAFDRATLYPPRGMIEEGSAADTLSI
jgi:hypothetical protein